MVESHFNHILALIWFLIRLPKRFQWQIFERNCQSSFWDTPLNCYMLSVAHVTNDVKWRLVVTTFGTLIANMSRTGLYDCHILKIFLDDFMSNINCGIGVLHVKRQILTYFCDVIFMLALVFILSVDRAYKEVSTLKYWTFSMAQFLWYDCTFKKQCTVPVTVDL